ncbi:MAG: tetratricopeptide repeat protein [Gemmatimonadota bacterium]|nr:MAG: tetratricopeptide repeat protein [Gemmatimonadota bacterium]
MIGRRVSYSALALLCALSVFASWEIARQVRAQEPTAAEHNFEYLWQTFDRNYGIFGPKRVDWGALYRVYRPLVTAETTDDELFEIMSRLLGHLNDNHVGLATGTRQYRSGILSELRGEGFAQQEMADFSLELVRSKYLAGELQAEGILRYGWLPDSIGYLRIRGYSQLAQTSQAIDQVMREFERARSIVVDLRATPGGDDRVGKAIADRFADRKRLYMKTYERNGPAHDDFAPPKYFYVEPTGPVQFTKPMVVLTNRWGVSAAENFALAMRTLPHVTLIGDFTSGVFADVYGDQLPNGWRFSVSYKLFVDNTGFCWEGIGVPPDLRIINKPEDIAAGRDRVLEFALDFVGRGESSPKDVSRGLADVRESWVGMLEREVEEGAPAAASFETSLAAARAALSAAPDAYYVDEDELLALAEELAASNRLDDAAAVLGFAAETFPASYRPWRPLAEGYLRTGDEAKAREAYAMMLERNRRSYPWEREAARVADAVLSGLRALVPALEAAPSDEEFAAAIAAFRAEPTSYYFNESEINSLGYRLLAEGQVERAIEVFLINTQEYPESANVWDSLGDGYRAKGDTAQAIASYRKALEVDPSFAASRQNLEELTGRQ